MPLAWEIEFLEVPINELSADRRKKRHIVKAWRHGEHHRPRFNGDSRKAELSLPAEAYAQAALAYAGT